MNISIFNSSFISHSMCLPLKNKYSHHYWSGSSTIYIYTFKHAIIIVYLPSKINIQRYVSCLNTNKISILNYKHKTSFSNGQRTITISSCWPYFIMNTKLYRKATRQQRLAQTNDSLYTIIFKNVGMSTLVYHNLSMIHIYI